MTFKFSTLTFLHVKTLLTFHSSISLFFSFSYILTFNCYCFCWYIYIVMENTPPFLSNLDSDFSSGYLQDALFKFSSKRRRLLLFDDNENYQTKDSNDSMKVYRWIIYIVWIYFFIFFVNVFLFYVQNLWSSNMDQHFSEDCDSFSQLTKCDSFSGNSNSSLFLLTIIILFLEWP